MNKILTIERDTAEIITVSRERIEARTRELALIAGRIPPHVVQADYEQAKRELTGESDLDRQAAILGVAEENVAAGHREVLQTVVEKRDRSES